MTDTRKQLEAIVKAKNRVTQGELRHLFDYSQETGNLVWKNPRTARFQRGQIAGVTLNTSGYKSIKINNTLYHTHRIVWLYVYGEWPEIVDHINGVRTDNRIANLRNVDCQMNAQNTIIKNGSESNNVTGYQGVRKTRWNRFASTLRIGGKQTHIGTFDTAEEAHASYLDAKAKHHKGFKDHNNDKLAAWRSAACSVAAQIGEMK